MIRILVKASSAIVRAGLEQMLASESDFHLVSETRRSHADKNVADEELPDVVVAEIEGADDDAEWSDLLDFNGPGSALLLLVDDQSPLSGAEALRLGVRGILPRRISREELVAGVYATAAGLIVLHPDGASSAFPARPPGVSRAQTLIEPLTAREKEVLAILAEGGSNKDIALRLSISDHTAKFHVSSIMSKLGATSRTEAVTVAIRLGIIMV